MDAVSKRSDFAFSADNKAKDSDVKAGGLEHGNEYAGLNTAANVADVNHVNSVWNKSVPDFSERSQFVDGKSYN